MNDRLTEKVRAMLTDVGEDIRRLASDAMRGLIKSPPWVGRKLADVECTGMGSGRQPHGRRARHEQRKGGWGDGRGGS